MHRSRFHLPLLLACLLLVTACAGGGKAKKAEDPMDDVDPSALTTDVFVLSDERDMSYAMVKLEKEGHKTEDLAEAARILTIDHLMDVLKTRAEHAAIVQATPSGWIIEARNLTLDDVSFATANILIKHERYKIKGHPVSIAKLQRVILNGREATVDAAWILYRDALLRAVQQ